MLVSQNVCVRYSFYNKKSVKIWKIYHIRSKPSNSKSVGVLSSQYIKKPSFKHSVIAEKPDYNF